MKTTEKGKLVIDLAPLTGISVEKIRDVFEQVELSRSEQLFPPIGDDLKALVAEKAFRAARSPERRRAYELVVMRLYTFRWQDVAKKRAANKLPRTKRPRSKLQREPLELIN